MMRRRRRSFDRFAGEEELDSFEDHCPPPKLLSPKAMNNEKLINDIKPKNCNSITSVSHSFYSYRSQYFCIILLLVCSLYSVEAGNNESHFHNLSWKSGSNNGSLSNDSVGDDLWECRQMAHSKYLSPEDLDRACRHRHMWLKHAESDYVSSKTVMTLSSITERQKAYLSILRRQTTLLKENRARRQVASSLPSAASNLSDQNAFSPQPLDSGKAIRREFRLLSTEERHNLTTAMNALKRRMIDNISVWDLHTIIHYPDSAPGAHWGPGFLPWHREFLRQFETALHREVPGVALPYWDSTLDHGLPEPSDSVMWTDELMGNGNGYVRNGPFKDWDTNVLMPLSPVPVRKLFRSTGGRPQDRLLSPRDVDWIMNRSNYSELTFCHDKTFESMHGLSHVWVGGFMFVIRVSPNDPTFYMHHAFVDYVWERFRQKQQTRRQREKDYARKICNKNHSFNAPMTPFNLKNRDGMSNDYTDYWYEYEPVRHCTEERISCDSVYLFCDQNQWRCRSRVQLGGNCTGFMGTDICYKSICIQNVCRMPATEGNGFIRRERIGAGSPQSLGFGSGEPIIWVKSLLLTDDNRPLSSGIAHVTIHAPRKRRAEDGDEEAVVDLTNSTTVFMQRSTHYPEIPGLIYLPLPQPSDGRHYNVSLEARDHYGRYCQSYCMNSTTETYQVCEPKLRLSSRNDASASNVSYTHSFSARRFLDVDLSVHPSRWQIFTPFMVFACHRKMVKTSSVRQIADQIAPPLEKAEYVWFRVTVLKKASSTLNLDNLQIESEDLDDRSDLWISTIRRARSTFDQSVVFVRARNPRIFHNGVRVRVALRNEGVRIDCDVKCHTNSVVVDDCDSQVFLHEEASKSQEHVFTSDPSFLQLLGWRMVGHPAEWRLQMSYLSFYC